MERKVQSNPIRFRAETRRKAKGRRAQGNRGFASPTPNWGRSAEEEFQLRTPVFGNAGHRCLLKYYEAGINVTATTGLAGNHFFSANGCFDPNVTGTGHQPMGFDQMMLFYEQYTVVRSKISIGMLSGGAVAPRSGVYLSPDTTSITDPNRLMENA